MEVEILGSELRAARLQKELSLDEVEQELRIRAKFLGAIEAGDYSLLPSQVQARGFLRNYAQFLGLDASTTPHATSRQWASSTPRRNPTANFPNPPL
jgi:cytoskeletal protein RodZ